MENSLLVELTLEAHVIKLEINSYGDDIGWWLSRYTGPSVQPRAKVDRSGIEIGMTILLGEPSWEATKKLWKSIPQTESNSLGGNSDFEKIASEDDSNKQMARDERYNQEHPVQIPGIYMLDFSDWNDTARVEVALSVNGENWFRGSGSSANMRAWCGKWEDWKNVKQIRPRGIAFLLE